MNKLGIILTTYNRPEYLKQTLDSITRASIPKGTTFLICDDASKNEETLTLISKFSETGYIINKFFNESNKGVAYSLLRSFKELFVTCDVVMNLDSDALVRNDFVDVLLSLHDMFPDYIKTGFHSTTKNRDGSERHKILTGDKFAHGNFYCEKESVGGINMMMNKKVFKEYVEPALIKSVNKGGNWDHMSCINSMKRMMPIICSVPSVVQHIGFDSSMNHNEAPDVADDFKPLVLNNVTLIGVDCIHLGRLLKAADICQENIEFADVKMLSSMSSNDPRAVMIESLNTKEAYSEFIIKKLNDYVQTDYALIIQHDGYIKNYAAWSNEFLKYDYIGAHWWYEDKKNVGNGGFSLRSKRLIEILANDKTIKKFHPEDHHICRTHHDYLVKNFKIEFAPEDVAAKFSIEGHYKKVKYNNQFGFHGSNVVDVKPVSQTLVINQFRGLGDILFCIPLVRKWIEDGFHIIWPVVPEYLDIQKYFPEIEFIDMNKLKINYDSKLFNQTQYGKVIPLRWADKIRRVDYKYCMASKYLLFDAPVDLWRKLEWERDYATEEKLFYEVLGLKDGEKFTLINKTFRTDRSGHINIPEVTKGTVINMQPLKGFTLLDWALVIERASEIHTVGTSINYLIEVLNCQAKEIHLYVRRPDEKDFSYYDYLLKKDYIYHN